MKKVQKKSSSKKGIKEINEGMEEMNSNNELVHKKIIVSLYNTNIKK